ncbi:hypothetical protein AB0M80_18630 [Amycolatopsis sp. NPDC051045]|uniref:hypothetical protein n=1 Tax=Amycolatopsis sp. NPDC051045 TaxID=3156922 RepID=UPI00343ABABC
MKKMIAVLAAAAALVTGAVVAAPAAGAAPGGSADFGAQARAAGLSAGQAAFLDRESAFYLAGVGGKRVGPNVIDLDGTGTVRIALPGEDAPRDLPLADGTRLTAHCGTGGAAYTYFCAYPNEFFRGTAIEMYSCRYYGIPWTSTGSWDNNQTAGTRPTQYYTDGRTRLLPAAKSAYTSGVNWNIVSGIKPC